MRGFSRLFLSSLSSLCLVASALAAPQVSLVDAGTGDRQEIRFTPKVGATETYRLVLSTEKGQDMGGDGKWTDLPPIAFDVTGEATAIAPDGRITYALTVQGAELLPEDNGIDVSAGRQAEIDAILDKIRPRLAKMKGARGTLEIASTGTVISSDFAPPPGAEGTQFDDLEKALAITRTVFPVEPIGEGATWTAEERVTERGMSVDQTITYTLKGLEDGRATVTQSIVRKGDHESLQMKSKLPPGTSVTLAALASEGRGETVVELGRMFPSSGDLADSFEARLVVNKDGQVMQLGNVDKLALKVESR
jgi:hypothetical protein